MAGKRINEQAVPTPKQPKEAPKKAPITKPKQD